MTQATSILGMFARSPIKPIQEHMVKVYACVALLPEFFSKAFSQDWEKAEALTQQISMIEREADDMKKDLRLHLPNSLFLPVSRADLLELIRAQDKLANRAKDISGLMLGRKMVPPESMIEPLVRYVQRSIDACKKACKTIEELDELVETGFVRREIDFIEAMICELDDIEQDTDTLQRELRLALFSLEKNMPPVSVMFLYEMIELIGGLADEAQQVGSRMQLLLAR